MPTPEQIEQQKELLASYRRTLYHYLHQKALLGEAYIPPGVQYGIYEARSSIDHIKRTLHDWGVDIEDDPNDFTVNPEPIGKLPNFINRPNISFNSSQSHRITEANSYVESSERESFKNKVANTLKSLNYQVTILRNPAENEVDIVCKRLDPLFPITYFIDCQPERITVESINGFYSKITLTKGQLSLYTPSFPVLIHQGRIEAEALELANRLSIVCYEFINLIREVWNFDQYLYALDNLYVESDIESQHVPLDCQSEKSDITSLEDTLYTWYKDDQRRYMALLGDYGTGKTWTCLRFANKMAEEFRTNPNRNPLPLLIGFRRYRPDLDLASLVKAELNEQYGIDVPRLGSLIKLLSSGNIILIIDGLDEMAKVSGERSALIGFRRLGLPINGPKVLITCRTHYFYSGDEQREVLSPESKSRILKSNTPNFEIIHILPFDTIKANSYIDRKLNHEESLHVKKIIRELYDLQELSSRPVLLQMICDSYNAFANVNTHINSAVLYEEYTRYWIEREISRGRLTFEPNEILALIEDIAQSTVQGNSLIFSLNELETIISSFLRENNRVIDVKTIERQLITSTFIRRSHEDWWSFSHRSFQEFFYARMFFRWEQETNGLGNFSMISVPIWQFAAQIALYRWDYSKALQWIPKRIDRSADPDLTLTTLRAAAAYWLIKNTSDRLAHYPLEAIMLDWVDLKETDFASCNLTNSDFSYSDLNHSQFQDACLKGITLYSTNLTNTSLISANLNNANCRGAILIGAEFKDTNIQYVDFRGANFGIEGSREWRQTMSMLLTCPGVDTAKFDAHVHNYLSSTRGRTL